MPHRASRALDRFSAQDMATLLRARDRQERQAKRPRSGVRVEERAKGGANAKAKPWVLGQQSPEAPWGSSRPVPAHSAPRSSHAGYRPREGRGPKERQRGRRVAPARAADHRGVSPAAYTRSLPAQEPHGVSHPARSPHAKSSRTRPATEWRTETTSRSERSAPKNSLSHLVSRFGAFATAVMQWFFDLAPRVRRSLVLGGALALMVAFFYAPAADLYAALRDHRQLERQSEQAQELLNDLEERVATLQSEEGIIDEARIRGYVMPGDHAADASELLGEDDGAKPPPYSLEQETPDDPFYIQVLDKLLGYQGPRS